MLKRSKKIVSVILIITMVLSVFAVMPFTANAAVELNQEYVVDLKKQHYEYYDIDNNKVDVTYRLPRIIINGNDISDVNLEILQKYESEFEIAEECVNRKDSQLAYTRLDYNYYINDNILSVLIFHKYPFNSYIEYSVYNFDLSSGERLNNQDIANRLSCNYADIKNVIIDEIKASFDEVRDFVPEKTFNQLLGESVSDINLEDARLYIGENNQLIAMYRIYWVAGAGVYYHLMPVEVNYFVLKQDTNQFRHNTTSYYLNNKKYREKLYWDSLATWDSTIRIYDQMYNGATGGVCHGIALSMCYANQNLIDFNALSSGANNYWELGSIYDNNKTRFKDLVIYYHLTQLTANGGESYSVSKGGWHIKSEKERLTEFLKKLKNEAEESQKTKKPFVFSFHYNENNETGGHSVVVCGYYYNNEKNEHEIKIYDENTYPSAKYSTMKISSDFSSFTFTDANHESSGKKISDMWTKLEVYDIDKLYSGSMFDSISVVDGNVRSSSNNTTDIYVTADKKFRLTNSKGEYLEYDGENYLGNMTVYDCTLVDNLDSTYSWKITVDKSSSFIISDSENNLRVIGETNEGGFDVLSSGADEINITGQSVSVEGNNYDFDIALQTQGSKDFIRIQGDALGDSVFENNNENIDVKSDKYISSLKVTSCEFDNAQTEEVDNNINHIVIDEDNGGIVEKEILDFKFGDVNGDTEVNAKDRMMLTRYLAKWTGYENIDTNAADVNNDGVVNAKDRMILTRHLAKWKGYETLPYKD